MSAPKKPVHIDPADAWFWTDEWQAGEAEADAELAAGMFAEYDNVEDFLASLHDLADSDAP